MSVLVFLQNGQDSFNLLFTFTRLSALEEMIINDNTLNELPSSIGLLRNLNTLIADHNLLKELPHSICSCVSLRILSLADNNIRQLPEDLGRLTSLKVMNFSNNILSYLPFSLTQIEYKSLWLSDNQNRPILQLNSELRSPYQKVLTCVLLPQVHFLPISPAVLYNYFFVIDQRRACDGLFGASACQQAQIFVSHFQHR